MSARKWFLVALGALLAGLAEATFSTLLPSPWRDMRPVLALAVLFVVLGRPRAGLVWAGLGGLMADLYVIGPSPFSFARLILTVGLVLFLSVAVLTNRSVYATGVLMAIARTADWLMLRASAFLSDALFHVHMSVMPPRELAIVLAWDLGLVTVTFVVLASFTRRFLVTAPFGYRPYDES
ncbi:hypothetical protein L0Y59_00605 [Candidatus Uhrbacteria bacterium]|nr:hypothetical protein [Candidatus Uhrbacteria bacterium]